MPEPITAQFVNALFSNDDTVRKAAAAKLGVRDPRLLEPEDYLIEVANRLGRRQARSALPRLQELLGHPDVLVRASAAGAVAKIDPALGLPMLEALLEEDNREVRSRVVDALCDTDAPEVAGLLSRILLSLYPDNRAIDPSDDWTRDLRRRMTLTLGLEGDAYALPSLTHAARDGDPTIRSNAIRALGLIKNVEALPVLLQGLDDRDAAVRRQAAHALNGLEDPQAVDALLRTLHDPDPMVAATAVAALASSRVQRAEPELLRLMGGESNRVAHAAAAALRRVGYDLTVPTLIDRLASPDTDTETRVAATAALGMIGNREALMPLVAALRSRTVPVRMAAARALGRLGDRRAGPYLADVLERDPSAEVVQVAAQALGQLGDPSIAYALEAAKTSPNTTVRQAAQMALIRVGRSRITPEDPSQRTRHRAPRLLMKRGTFDLRI